MEETTELILTRSRLDMIESALADHRELLYFSAAGDAEAKRDECNDLIKFIRDVKKDLEWDNGED